MKDEGKTPLVFPSSFILHPSSFSTSVTGKRRLDIHLKHALETEGGDQRHDKPVDHPPVASARLRGSPRIIDLDRPDERVRRERPLPGMDKDLRPVPTRPLGADAHEAV